MHTPYRFCGERLNPTQLKLLHQLANTHGVALTIVLDLVHVLEYLWNLLSALRERAFCEFPPRGERVEQAQRLIGA